MPTPDPTRPHTRLIDSDAGPILNTLDELDALAAAFARALDGLAVDAATEIERATERRREQQQGGDAAASRGAGNPDPAPFGLNRHGSEPSAPQRAHELFHVEQCDQPPTDTESHTDEPTRPDPGALLAHELANLATAISGRAQRALRTNNPEHARAALELASDLSTQTTLLCELFMANHNGTTPPLDHTQIHHIHESALHQLADHPLTPHTTWSESLDPRARCPLPPALLTRVLVNLYTNALTAIDRQRAHNPDHTPAIRLGSQMTCGTAGCNCSTWNNCPPHPTARACARSGVEIWVEDSGDGFGSCKSLSGHGFGLDVCRRIAAGWGGVLVVGDSDLGGARVGIRFVDRR